MKNCKTDCNYNNIYYFIITNKNNINESVLTESWEDFVY